MVYHFVQEEGAVGGREENSFTTNGHQTTNILQSLREYRRREFKPNHRVSVISMKARSLESGLVMKNIIVQRMPKNDLIGNLNTSK